MLTIVWVGTRQNVLAVLLHEQVHRLSFRSRAGELLTNACIAYPLMITLGGYRRVHMAHHAHYHSDMDPDYTRKQGDEWTFPQRVWQLVRNILIDLTGTNVIKTLRSKNMSAQDGRPESRFEKYFRFAYYVTALAILLITGTWPYFLLYWIVPLFTVMQAIIRWSAICEHRYDNPSATLLESTPFIELRWWERLVLTNLNFITYHVYHHLHPAVPWTKLPLVHQIYKEEGLVRDENAFEGFGDYLNFLAPRSAPSRVKPQTAESVIDHQLRKAH